MVEDQDIARMNQSLCYSGKLMPLKPGQIISVSGKTKADAKHLELCLKSDSESKDEGDIQLHLFINIESEAGIVRNSYTKDSGWGKKEETENLHAKNPRNLIRPGEDFKISIYIDIGTFFISINEKPFCSFDYRMPLTYIHKINIFGDVERVHEVNHNIAMPKEPLSVSKTCFGGSIPAIKPGAIIVFKGIPRGSKNGHFLIEMFGSCSPVALFQVLIKFEDEEVIATAQDQHPYREVDVSPIPFPFKVDWRFKAAVGVTNSSFVFTVNGSYILKIPFYDQCFIGHPASFQMTACDELEVEIKRVDVFLMEGPSKSRPASTKEFANISKQSQLE